MRTLLLMATALTCLLSNIGECSDNSSGNRSGNLENGMKQLHNVIVSVNAIRMPVGFFILVRDGGRYGAFRFLEMRKLSNYEAEGGYEAYCQEDGSGDLLKKNAEHEIDTLSQKQPFPIIGRLSVSRGNISILCGHFRVPTTGSADTGWMYFRDNSLMEPGDGVWLAPTAITDISKVNIFDSRLKWYRHDDSRKDFELDLSGLLNGDESPPDKAAPNIGASTSNVPSPRRAP